MSAQTPVPGKVFADMLWNTSRLPNLINGVGPTSKKSGLAASIDGVTFSVGANPANITDMLSVVNSAMGAAIYNVLSGFDCQNAANCVGGCRYVVFGGNADAPSGTTTQPADILELSSTGAILYFGQVDWRAPPYNPAPIAP